MIRKLKSYFSQLIRGHLVIWPRSRPRPCTTRPAPLLLSAAYYYYYSLLTWIFRGRIREGGIPPCRPRRPRAIAVVYSSVSLRSKVSGAWGRHSRLQIKTSRHYVVFRGCIMTYRALACWKPKVRWLCMRASQSWKAGFRVPGNKER